MIPGEPAVRPSAGRKIPTPARQALWLWTTFFVVSVVIHGTVPFMVGIDLRAWTESPAKGFLFGLAVYGGLFMAAPLLLTTARSVARRPGFWVPLIVGVGALGAGAVFRPANLTALVVLLYLHLRYDLSVLGVRAPTRGRDVVAVAFLGLLPLVVCIVSQRPWSWEPGAALRACVDRLLLNPASSTENLFYFGFLAGRLRVWAGRWGTPGLIGALYTAHEMSNPEYWYEGMNFAIVFAGVCATTAVYLWSRNSVVIWLSSGLARFVTFLW